MAEPAGIVIKAHISAKKLSSLFRRKVPHETGKSPIGRVLSILLDESDTEGDILIVNHDRNSETLFVAWIMNHYAAERAAVLWPVLDALAEAMDQDALGKGAVISTLPQCLESIRIEDRRLKRGPARLVSRHELETLHERFWSFACKEQFPDAAKSMRRRNYHCKPFRTAWKNYVKWRDEQERPARIAAATAESPYSLMPGILCWDGQVVNRDKITGRDIPFPDADPFSFRSEAGFFADKNYVWKRRLAADSPPKWIETSIGCSNNPEAIWEYHKIEGAVGADFTWLFDRWDTTYWTDKRRIYAIDENEGLIALPGINASQFRIHRECFGTDGKSIIYGTSKLKLIFDEVKTEGCFIWDKIRVYMLETELPLSGKTFSILGRKVVRGLSVYTNRR